LILSKYGENKKSNLKKNKPETNFEIAKLSKVKKYSSLFGV